MDDKITLDFIINALKERVESKEAQFDTKVWIETGLKINILLGNEQDELFRLRQEYEKKVDEEYELLSKPSMERARMKASLGKEWLDWQKQEAKIKRAEEFVRLVKKMSDRVQGW